MSSRPKRAASANVANVIAAEKANKAAYANAKYAKTERGRASHAKANAKYAKTERGRASLVLPTHPRFGSHYKPRPGARPYTYYGYEWFSQLLRMIKSGGPKNLKAWVRLAKEGVVKCHILSPTGVHAWPKMWATKLEAQLQLMFMPTRLHRRPLHQGTCRNYSTAPGITGVIELTSAFYRMYPNATFVFNKETAAKGTYRGEEETAASWWLKHVG